MASKPEKKNYKWPTPHAWLKEKITTWDKAKLLSLINQVIDDQDADFIQDTFQKEMDEDGYFKEIKP